MRGPDQYIRTFTGRPFWPLDPRVEDICIEDIAHALSNNCRWGGHCSKFYSVAQHSVFVSDLLGPQLSFVGLLHDASEAYLLDMPRPVKYQLADYRAAEDCLMKTIFRKFGLSWPMDEAVKTADDIALYLERLIFFNFKDSAKECLTSLAKVKLGVMDLESSMWRHAFSKLHSPFPPTIAEELFLTRFNELYASKNSPKPGPALQEAL